MQILISLQIQGFFLCHIKVTTHTSQVLDIKIFNLFEHTSCESYNIHESYDAYVASSRLVHDKKRLLFKPNNTQHVERRN